MKRKIISAGDFIKEIVGLIPPESDEEHYMSNFIGEPTYQEFRRMIRNNLSARIDKGHENILVYTFKNVFFGIWPDKNLVCYRDVKKILGGVENMMESFGLENRFEKRFSEGISEDSILHIFSEIMEDCVTRGRRLSVMASYNEYGNQAIVGYF